MKKFWALLLALVMIMSMAITVSADEQDHEHHIITINETNWGHTYEAYQIFAGRVVVQDHDNNAGTPDVKILSDVRWGSGVDKEREVDWGTDESLQKLTLVEALRNPTVNPDFHNYYITELDKLPSNATDDKVAAAVAEALSTRNTTAHGEAFSKIVSRYLNETNKKTSVPYKQNANNSFEVVGSKGEWETAQKNNQTTNYQIQGLSDGYYLVKESQEVAGETATNYILHLVENVVVEPKDGDVTVEKKIIEGGTPVDACSNNIGDVITFQITGDMPENLAMFESFYYAFADTLSAGLTLNEDSIELYTVNGDTEKLIDPAYYTVYMDDSYDQVNEQDEYEDVPEEFTKNNVKANFVVEFTDIKALTNSNEYTLRSITKICLKYTATLNSQAEIGNDGNPNEVYLRYDRNPYTEFDPSNTPEDIVYVFTFQLDATKINGETLAKLNGVEFVLARERSGRYQYAVLDEGKTTVKGWTNWINEEALRDYVSREYNTLVDDPNRSDDEYDKKVNELRQTVGIATTLITENDGQFSVTGLDLDLYWLIETKPLDGYDEIEPIKFTISADYDSATQKAVNLKITIDNVPKDGDADSGIVGIEVVNNPGHELPTTGGIGTTIFYVVGGILVAAALVLLITKKRMSR